MAKDLRAKMVLDIGDLRSSLSQAERETRKTVAAIERDSKVSINKMRLDLGSNAREFAQSRRDNLGIGGGPDARYNGMYGATQRKSSEYGGILAGGAGVTGSIAKAAPYVAAVSLGLNAANVAVDIFQGKFDSALETAKQIPIIGSAIIKPVVEIGEKVGWIKKNTEDAAGAMASYAERAKIAADFTNKIKAVRSAVNADTASIGRSDSDQALVNLAERRKTALLAIDQQLIESTRKARIERNKITEGLDRSDPRAKATDARFQDERKRMQEQAAAAKRDIETNYFARTLDESRKATNAENEQRMAAGVQRDAEREALKPKPVEPMFTEADRGAAMLAISERRAEEQITRQRQSRYDAYGGNAALVSQSLTRVPGGGNVSAVEDKKLAAEVTKLVRSSQNMERLAASNQLAVAPGI